MKKLQKLLSAGISLTAALCYIMAGSVPAQMADAPKIVVIGDGISSGAKLADGEKSYVDWIAYYTDAEIQNFAQDDYMTADILASLNNMQVQQALSEADIILVTAGINDIMIPFFELANSYMEEFGFSEFQEVFSAKLKEYGFESEDELLPYSNKLASAARMNQKTAGANLQTITETLSQYQNAKIIYQTVYNATDTIENINNLSSKRQAAYNGVRNPIKTVVTNYLNNFLHEQEETGHIIVVDTFTGFAGLAYQYTNLNYLDANPTAEGHIWIADAVMEAAGLEKKPEETIITTSETTTSTTTSTTSETTTSTTTSTTSETTTSTTTSTISETTTSTTTSTISETTTSTTTSTTPETTSSTTTSTTPETTTSTTTSTTSETTTSTTTSTTSETTTSTTTSTTPETIPVGDLNHDNVVDAADAAEILKAAANLGAGYVSGLSPELEKAADVNGDSHIDAADSAIILAYAAGKGSGTITDEFENYLKTL